MVPTLGGVHKIQILIRDLLKQFLHKIFGEEMRGVTYEGDYDKKTYTPWSLNRLFNII